MSGKVIITAAITGSAPTKEQNPAVPYSPKEISDSALECWREGAAIVHIHVRDPITGVVSLEKGLFQEVVQRIREQSDILINLTTSGFHLDGKPEDQHEIRLEAATLGPDICSLDVGTLNFRGGVFLNSPEWGQLAAKRMRAYGVKPEIEVFDSGHISQAIDLIEGGLIDDPPYFQLCMGVKWGIEATIENLLFMKRKLPQNAKWSVLGVGKSQLPMIAMGILLGGNIRVGFEDNLYLRKGELADSNAQFVGNAVKLIRQLQKEIASPDEAREILGLRMR